MGFEVLNTGNQSIKIAILLPHGNMLNVSIKCAAITAINRNLCNWRGGDMSKISSDDVKEYLATGGKIVASLALKLYGDSINQAGETAFSDAIEIGIKNTMAALYDADVNDDEIIRVLNKYWGINRDEAENRLVYEKCQAAIRELERYLKMQGFSSIEINQFMKSNNASIKIRHNNELWRLRRKPEKLMKEVQASK